MTLKSILLGAATGLSLALSSAIGLADVVKVGVLAPLSGKASADGQEVANGAQLAVNELNGRRWNRRAHI